MSRPGVRHAVVEEDLREIVAEPLDWDAFRGRTVLVSGANGFLPAYMVETLLFLNETRPGFGCRVVGLVRSRARAEARFSRALEAGQLELVTCDLAKPLPPIEGAVDFVIHAASQASPKYFGKDPVGTLAPNVFGTQALLELAREKKSQRVLFFSSGEVYGTVDPAAIPIKETSYGVVDPTQVRSCYAESKRMGETLCVAWHAQYGVAATIARPFHTYGPGMLLDDGRVFSDFVADVVAGRHLTMKSDGSAIRPYCYLADATRGFFTVLLEGEAGQAYNVGNDQAEVSVRQLAETLARLFPEKKLEVRRVDAPAQPGYLKSPIPRNCPDLSKIAALGWTPRHGIESGFSRTIRSFT